jgi:GTP-binding protein
VLTNARPAIGAYPFTTLSPEIGMLGNHAIADIPGLIKGASKGKGLGIRFLQHIEKTKILLHCIDLTEHSPTAAYDTIRGEMNRFDHGLLEKPEYIVLTKTDLVPTATVSRFTKIFEKRNLPVFSVSIYDEESINRLKKNLLNILDGT